MNSIPSIPQTCSSISEPHFHTAGEERCQNRKSKFNMLIKIMEKISAIAIGIFSAYVNWKLFVSFFFAGVCIELYNHIQGGASCDHPRPVSSCAHGLLEQQTGINLPPLISLAANVAITICHIDHHETVFVPITGISLGMWVEKTVSHCVNVAYKKNDCRLLFGA